MKYLREWKQRLLAIGMMPLIVLPLFADKKPPNVLFIAVDDLNDWIGCMGGNTQSVTPNFDRLAASGMLFTNAHCVAASCNPSRTATMTGRSSNKTGVYNNGQKMREVLPKESILPKYFSEHGYWSGGSGKMLHYFIDEDSWDEYFPKKNSPIPNTLYPEVRPVSLPKAGPWQYVETDWGPLDVTDETFGGDYLVSKWVGEKLSKKHEKPFFLACGIYRPHEPWFVPKKYFDKFPLEDIKLPVGFKEGDLDDLPESGKRRGPNRYFKHIRKHGQWKQAIQGYLASIHFADAMLGRVLDALENGPNEKNTIVVLWSDHGWHLGEKQHWQKYSAWRACTRVPLMVKVPKGISSALPDGVKPGVVCDHPVSLLSLFPTLTELSGIPGKKGVDGRSMVPLLKDPMVGVDEVVVTYLGYPGSYGLSSRNWRYIRYADGGEELYDIRKDPYEWDNLAKQPEYESKLVFFRDRAPKHFVPVPKPSIASLPMMKWVKLKDGMPPVSKPDGRKMRLAFINKMKSPVKLHWVTLEGELKLVGAIAAGKSLEIQGKPGSVWAVTDPGGKRLGYFVSIDRPAKGVVR